MSSIEAKYLPEDPLLPSPIKLLVGLGNPGTKYDHTRHNAGRWLVEKLAAQQQLHFQTEPKFQAQLAVWNLPNGGRLHLMIPSTYMNESGLAVGAFARFYQLSAPEILVAHDELDFPAGVVRLKCGGGHGGHNGLRSLAAHLASSDFNRLRVGIGHPGHKDQVHDYVLNSPSKADRHLIQGALDEVIQHIDVILAGNFEQGMRLLHQPHC